MDYAKQPLLSDMYKYSNTITNGAEKLIDGIENIEMFLGNEDLWNFHDSDIYALHFDRKSSVFTCTLELCGCDFSKLEGKKKEDSVLLDFNFEGCIDIHMLDVDPWNMYLMEIEMSIYNGFIQCWFNGPAIRITSRRLRVDKPRIVAKPT